MRYGGAKLDIQAINCIPPAGVDAQDAVIGALKLLQEFGYRASPEQKQDLLARTAAHKPVVHTWIETNL